MPAAPEQTLEERFGTQWVVWIGGLALALGAVFLVRYTVEQGLLGPGVRIFLASLFAAALIAAGEWTRRNEIAAGIAAIPAQHIPSILTAAGTVAAYATVYAAYALYGFLSPAAAFILLGIVALATLAAALLHGPALAGLGLAGAYLAPALVATREPNFWALYLYLIVVNAAAFTLARMRLWRWLAITAVVLGALWALPGVTITASSRSTRTSSISPPALRSPPRSSFPDCCSAPTPSPARSTASHRAPSAPICSRRPSW